MKKEFIISNGLRSFIIILAGMLSAGLVHGFVFALITINNLDFSGCNSIVYPYLIAAEWYYASLILVCLSIIISIFLFFRNETSRFLSIGIIISILYPAIIFFKVYDDYKSRDKYFRKFEQSEWKKATYKPLPVARWLDRENIFKGKSPGNIIEMLGEPMFQSDTMIRYELEFPGIYFEVYLEKDISISDTISCYL